MNEICLFYKLAITSQENRFYLNLLIKLINSKKYWRVAKNRAHFKRFNKINIFYEILTKIHQKKND